MNWCCSYCEIPSRFTDPLLQCELQWNCLQSSLQIACHPTFTGKRTGSVYSRVHWEGCAVDEQPRWSLACRRRALLPRTPSGRAHSHERA